MHKLRPEYSRNDPVLQILCRRVDVLVHHYIQFMPLLQNGVWRFSTDCGSENLIVDCLKKKKEKEAHCRR